MYEYVTAIGVVRVEHKRYVPPNPDEKSYVIDGDTVVVGGQHWRLDGFDAPEAEGKAHCEVERALGRRATEAMTALLLDAARRRAIVATIRGKKDKNGRYIVRLEIDGRSVGDHLIEQGLAVAHSGGPKAPFCGCRYRHDIFALQLAEYAERSARA